MAKAYAEAIPLEAATPAALPTQPHAMPTLPLVVQALLGRRAAAKHLRPLLGLLMKLLVQYILAAFGKGSAITATYTGGTDLPPDEPSHQG